MRNWTIVLLLVCTTSGRAIGAAACVKPFAVADRWTDVNGNGQYDAGESYDPLETGLVAPDDTGFPLMITAANPQTSTTSNGYFLVALPPLGQDTPPSTGEVWLRKWMSECAPYVVANGDSLLVEPGNLVSVLLEETDLLIASDPDAYWDDTAGAVAGSRYAVSPRLVSVPFFDPQDPRSAVSAVVSVTKVAVLFLEATEGPTGIQVRFVKESAMTTPVEHRTWGWIKRRW